MIALQVDNFRVESALSYARRGWMVIPLHWPKIGSNSTLCSCTSRDCSSIGKHPLVTNGLKDASADEAVIRNWWKAWPSANIGIVTGEQSGIVVLDIDKPKGGDDSFQKILQEHGEIPHTPVVDTGGGGTHIFFQHPGIQIRNSVGEKGWMKMVGIDIRGDGGYVVAAPSLHASGVRYDWRNAPDEVDLAQLPQWIISLSNPKPVEERKNGTPIEDADRYWLGKALAKANEGNRNDTGLWLAVQLRDAGCTVDRTVAVLCEYVQRCPKGDTSYTEREAIATARGVFSRPARDPARNNHSPRIRLPDSGLKQPVNGASKELHGYLRDIASQKIACVDWPWKCLSMLTQALIPGSVTTVVGDPGVGKTFFVLQCLLFWHSNGYEPAVYFIEKDRKYHMHRLLAMLESDGSLVDWNALKGQVEKIDRAIQKHGPLIDDLGRFTSSSCGKRITLGDVMEWITKQAESGKRVLVVDPITATDAGNERWIVDDDFMLAAEQTMTRCGCSLVLITHPKKGNRMGSPSGHDAAGGAAYFRFCDTLIWLHRPKTPKSVVVATSFGSTAMTPHLFFQLHKTRHGRGAGREIAFNFGEGLQFAEQGWVKKELKS